MSVYENLDTDEIQMRLEILGIPLDEKYQPLLEKWVHDANTEMLVNINYRTGDVHVGYWDRRYLAERNACLPPDSDYRWGFDTTRDDVPEPLRHFIADWVSAKYVRMWASNPDNAAQLVQQSVVTTAVRMGNANFSRMFDMANRLGFKGTVELWERRDHPELLGAIATYRQLKCPLEYSKIPKNKV